LSGFTAALPQGQMTIIQIDGGNNVESVPQSSAIGILYPGERMDIVVEWPEAATESNFTIILDAEYASCVKDIPKTMLTV
jgi:hypothetical protein